GTVLIAWAATLELRIADGLVAFDGRAIRALIGTLAASALLSAAGAALAPFGAPVRAVALLLLFWPAQWAALRFGLADTDRRELGSVSRRLKLVSA
ncbi:MAG TPA: hypothetical protein VE567_00040, partial [Sphingomonas sp.]|nr:hypothetical protein [Sphingomonas sp.]